MITAPCYDRADYWGYFAMDYSGLRVLDLGSSAGSYDKRAEFGAAKGSASQARQYVSLDIDPRARPGVVGDGHALPFGDATFDVIVANNVIEHLYDPAGGVREMRRVLRPGGQLLYTIPFLYPIHEAPHDYTRFTRYGLARLFREFSSVEIHERGGYFSTQAQFIFLLTRAFDRIGAGGFVRAVLYPFLSLAVQLDRFDHSGAFARVYYGRLRA